MQTHKSYPRDRTKTGHCLRKAAMLRTSLHSQRNPVALHCKEAQHCVW